MRKITFLSLIVFMAMAAVYFSSCEKESASNVDQDRVFTIYELYYNANADITYARATFKFGNSLGTLLQLSDSGAIAFQPTGQISSDILSFRNTLAYYEREYAGFVQSGTFVYEDEDGNVFSNNITIDSVAYPDTINDILKASSYELFWVGDVLDADDNVTLTIEGPYNGDMRVFYQNDEGASSIILPANKTSELGTGINTMFMDYRFEPDISQAPSAGGKITGRYRPVNRNIEVVE